MARPPKKSTIAKALGVSAPALSRYIRKGCPVDSIEAAREWQRANVDPTQRLTAQRNQARPATGTKYTGLAARLEQAFYAGAKVGRRSMLDWMLANQALGAAALIRHAGLPVQEACNAAAMVIHALHSAGRVLHQVEDRDINELMGDGTCDFDELVADLDRRDPPEKVAERAEHLARDLWPA